jgi:hypothetical protein
MTDLELCEALKPTLALLQSGEDKGEIIGKLNFMTCAAKGRLRKTLVEFYDVAYSELNYKVFFERRFMIARIAEQILTFMLKTEK